KPKGMQRPAAYSFSSLASPIGGRFSRAVGLRSLPLATCSLLDWLGVCTSGVLAAKARGMSKLAKDTGLGRESLYKALAPGAKPRYDTVLKLVRALGVELHTTPAHASQA